MQELFFQHSYIDAVADGAHPHWMWTGNAVFINGCKFILPKQYLLREILSGIMKVCNLTAALLQQFFVIIRPVRMEQLLAE
ncbi:hypothetical protein D3C75_1164130 [compost metagenome]